MSLLSRFVTVKPQEISALLVSCLYFYLVLCAYYIIRPIRSEMAIANGVENLQWLMLMAMLILFAIMPVFGWLTSRFKTQQFLAISILFFASHLVVFFFLFNVPERSVWVTRGFFVWVNVFNMFIVSLFWSFMNDVFSRAQSKRLFAFIAAGGTAGALTGPLITTFLVESVGLASLLLISACVLASSCVCVLWLSRWENVDAGNTRTNKAQAATVKNESLKGGIWGGVSLILKSPYLIGICLFIVLYAISITFVGIQQAEMVEQAFNNPTERTQLFSKIDFAANGFTLLFQLLLTSRLINTFGFRTTLMLIPVGITIGFGLMASAPVLAVVIGIEIFRRAGDYAIMKPTREMLFSVVSREEKYKAKNFIDTAIVRTGDTSSAWLYTLIKSLGVAGAGIAGISMVFGVAWCATAYWLGGQFNKRTKDDIMSS